jgi:hypothetical protein
MTPRQGKHFRVSERPEDLAITHRHAAEHFVKVPPADMPQGFVNPHGRLPEGVRKFATNTADLTVLEGISEATALVILSEIGPDVSKFAHEKNFASWLGLCPQHRGSAGKIFSRRGAAWMLCTTHLEFLRFITQFHAAWLRAFRLAPSAYAIALASFFPAAVA